MPGSAQEGKSMVRDFIIKNEIKHVLDIGPGEGTYYEALQGTGITRLDGIEAWAPYVNDFQLTNKYDNLIIGDVYYIDWAKLPYYDIVLFGDVLEHMPEEQGWDVILRAAKHSRWLVISLPIYGYPQGVSFDGNWFEAHVEQYSHQKMLDIFEVYGFTILEQMQGSILGVYILELGGGEFN